MGFEDSLEHDILRIFWELKRPLTVGQVLQALLAQHVQIPYRSLEKIIGQLVLGGVLQSETSEKGQIYYSPKVSAYRFCMQPIQFLMTGCLRNRLERKRTIFSFREWLAKARFLYMELGER